jgi:GST-like protein
MIELYAFPTPNGHKITIALEELALEYRIIPINISRGDQFLPEFLAISPNNRIPAIIDRTPRDGGTPVPVFESGAILMYLAEKAGRLLPAETRPRKTVLEWLMWQMGGAGPMLGQAHHFRQFAAEKLDYPIQRYTNEANRLYGVLEKRLQGRSYVADEYSIADIALFPWMMAPYHEWQGIEIAQYPNINAWLARIAARDAVQRGLHAGDALWKNPPLTADEKAGLFLR